MLKANAIRFIAFLRQMIGAYTPLDGEGIASLDIEYICGFILMLVCLIEFFKALRYVLRGITNL